MRPLTRQRGRLPRPCQALEQLARAEAWAAVAGEAQSLFWFTHTFTKGWWNDFDVSWEMGDAAWAGRFADTIPAFAVRIYGWVPQKIVSGRGL
jgi:hypothetical protein